MNVDDFQQAQRSNAAQNLHALFMSCRRKFLNAARLLELRGAAIENLRECGHKSVDLWPLMNMYSVVCDRYTDAFFSPQAKLFANPADAQDEKWGRYFHHVLVPHLLLEDEFVRNVLRAMMAIPCKNPQLARDALVQHVSEMTLPETRPLWAPEDEIDL
jgi:hypothetical protein